MCEWIGVPGFYIHIFWHLSLQDQGISGLNPYINASMLCTTSNLVVIPFEHFSTPFFLFILTTSGRSPCHHFLLRLKLYFLSLSASEVLYIQIINQDTTPKKFQQSLVNWSILQKHLYTSFCKWIRWQYNTGLHLIWWYSEMNI